MDDLFQVAPKTPVEEAWHKEQERKKYDVIRIKNPTSKDFYVKYDIGQFQLIPANLTKDVPQYIAIRYLIHMKDQIINDMIEAKHDKDIEERVSKGFPQFKSVWEENQETYLTAGYPKTDDAKLIAAIFEELWVGIVYEFGRDIPPGNANPRSGEVDLTSPEMKIMEGLSKKRVPDSGAFAPVVPSAPVIPSTFAQMNEQLDASEVTASE